MEFDFTGVEQFMQYLAGRGTLQQVWAHPAYQTVARHARRFSTGLNEQMIEAALGGQPSPFYGLAALSENLPRIRTLMAVIREQSGVWVKVAEANLRQLFPGEDLSITIYPILGYDMGIGLGEAVCLNCNYPAYLEDPREFLFFIIHEAVHVLYERRHRVAALSDVVTPADWRAYFALWTQNEGLAVYAPLRLREAWGCLAERDYRVLSDPPQLTLHRIAFLHALDRLGGETPLAREDYLEICFGSQRLTYRVGCELFRRIEQAHGLAAVREVLALEPQAYLGRYGDLLKA